MYVIITGEIDDQFENQAQLQAGKETIHAGIERLKQQKDQLQSSIRYFNSPVNGVNRDEWQNNQ
jgi:hypothetical protein